MEVSQTLKQKKKKGMRDKGNTAAAAASSWSNYEATDLHGTVCIALEYIYNIYIYIYRFFFFFFFLLKLLYCFY